MKPLPGLDVPIAATNPVNQTWYEFFQSVARAGHIKGSSGADSAGAGEVGEYWTNGLGYGSRVTLTSGVSSVVGTLTSLTPGDWDVSGLVNFETTGSPVAVYTSVVCDFAGADQPYGGAYNASVSNVSAVLPPQRVLITANTTINLSASTSWTGGVGPTVKAWGRIWARRSR